MPSSIDTPLELHDPRGEPLLHVHHGSRGACLFLQGPPFGLSVQRACLASLPQLTAEGIVLELRLPQHSAKWLGFVVVVRGGGGVARSRLGCLVGCAGDGRPDRDRHAHP